MTATLLIDLTAIHRNLRNVTMLRVPTHHVEMTHASWQQTPVLKSAPSARHLHPPLPPNPRSHPKPQKNRPNLRRNVVPKNQIRNLWRCRVRCALRMQHPLSNARSLSSRSDNCLT